MKTKVLIMGTVLVALLSPGYCSGEASSASEEKSSITPLSADQYLVSPKDVLQISIVGELDLPTTFEVSETDGTVKFPYIQYVKVSGLTVKWINKLITALLRGADPEKADQLMDELRRELRGEASRGGMEKIATIEKRMEELLRQVEPNDCWYKNPQVNVMVAKYSEKYFYVTGQVNKPGQFSFTGENVMTVYRAIIKAGGFTRIAKKKVDVRTKDENGNEKVVEIDIKKIERDPSLDPPIKANDIITVDESPW